MHGSGLGFALLGAFIATLYGAEPLAAPARHPVPSEAEQAEFLRLAKDVYKAEYSKSDPAGRTALARVLTDEAIKTKTDIPGAYVLFREAADVAVKLGDAPLALRAVKEMSRVFDVDGEKLLLATLSAAGRNAATPETQASVCEAWRGLAEESAAADGYDAALKHIAAAESAARNAKDLALLTDVQARAKELRGLQVEAAGVAAAKKKLQDAPDDPDANLVLGSFLCFVKEDWPKGVRHLAKGSNPVLKALAGREVALLAQGPDPTSYASLGDGWWQVAEKGSSRHKLRVLEHAAGFYEKASTGPLPAAQKELVAKRLDEYETAVAQVLGVVNLLKLVDPAKDAVSGVFRFDGNALLLPAEPVTPKIVVPYELPAEYQLKIVAERTSGTEALLVGVPLGASRLMILVDGASKQAAGVYYKKPGGPAPDALKIGPFLPVKKPVVVDITFARDVLTLKADGEKLFQWSVPGKAPLANPTEWDVPTKGIILASYQSTFRVLQFNLIPIGGVGKRLR
jgi:hypothetical protein